MAAIYWAVFSRVPTKIHTDRADQEARINRAQDGCKAGSIDRVVVSTGNIDDKDGRCSDENLIVLSSITVTQIQPADMEVSGSRVLIPRAKRKRITIYGK